MNKSIFFVLLLVVSAALADSSEEVVDKAVQKLMSNPALKKLVKLVEENKMNVSVVASEEKYFKNGQLKEAGGVIFRYPTQTTVLTESKLNKQIAQEFLDVATKEKLIAAARKIEIKDGNVVERKMLTNGKGEHNGLPRTNVYKWMTNVVDGQHGFVFNRTSFAVLTNFIVPGTDGRNETTSVIVDHVEMTIVEKSEGITDAEIAVIKKALPIMEMVLNDDINKAQALVKHLDKELPTNSWQVIMNPVDFYVASTKFALIDVAETKYLIFALVKK